MCTITMATAVAGATDTATSATATTSTGTSTTSDFSQNLNAIVPEHLVPKMLSSTLLVTSAGMTIGALEPLRASVAVRVSLLGARLRILPGLPLASSCKTTVLSSFR